ncbi:MAG: PepSY domain-containing protein [Hyphococcus sp.]
MSVYRLIQRIHLWAGLLLGIQVFLWMLSGVVMSWFHIELVRGERAMFDAPPPELESRNYASPGGVIAQLDGATSVELRYFLNSPVYEATTASGHVLFDAATGERISPISEETARAAARADYVGEGEIERIALMSDPPHEYRGVTPVWRADFDDRLHTRLYVSPETGAVLARRNDVWRLYDFFWMLHIMDYVERENFNNPIVRVASGAGLLFAVTGLFMVVMRKGRMQIAEDMRRVMRLGRRD